MPKIDATPKIPKAAHWHRRTTDLFPRRPASPYEILADIFILLIGAGMTVIAVLIDAKLLTTLACLGITLFFAGSLSSDVLRR